MKIKIENDLVEFIPEGDESKELGVLWDTIVDCVKFNKKLVPVGEYIPGTTAQARFAIEAEPPPARVTGRAAPGRSAPAPGG